MEPRSTVPTVLSAALGDPLCTSERNALPAVVPTFDTSIRTVWTSGASINDALMTEPAPSNFIAVTWKSGPARPDVSAASANGKAT